MIEASPLLHFLYGVLDYLLPFAWADHNFMKNALLAVLLVCPAFGLLSTMIVNNRMVFFADSLGHSALTGIGLGVILGLSDPLGSMVLFSALLAIAIVLVKNLELASTDTVIGVFSTTAVALGIVILSRGGGFNKYSRYLIGDLLSITPAEITGLALMALLVLLFWFVLFNRLLLVSVNGSLAKSRGVSVSLVEILFNILTAVIVAFSIKWVGLLIISSLLVLPAAAARILSTNMRQYHLLSLLFATISGISGLVISYYWATATGASIVLCASAAYFCTLLIRITVLR